jgi:hypothetical protein
VHDAAKNRHEVFSFCFAHASLGRSGHDGSALGLCVCLLAALIDPSDIASLIAHDAEPLSTAIILVSFFALTYRRRSDRHGA